MAHPDDEVLGAGGTLAKHAENGDEVAMCHLSAREHLRGAKDRAGAVLGLSTTNVMLMDLPDQQFDTVPFGRITWFLESFSFDPDVIYTHHPGDLNQDHALTAQAVLTAFRPKPGTKARTILACEVLSSTEYTYPPVFQPNYFVYLTPGQIEKKEKAMFCYPSELCEWPHPRSVLGIRNLAAVRGQQIGKHRAEAFQLLRAVWDD